MKKSKPLKIFRSSAGSGKTYTLVKEYISILLNAKDPLLFKKILAITFTNKAANEMKERVLETLKLLSSGEDSALMNDYLNVVPIPANQLADRSLSIFQHIIHHYGEFNILTIDKFIHRIIRSFTRELGLNMNFELESDVNLFVNRSIELLLSEVGNDKNLTSYLIQFSEQLIDNSEKGDIERKLKSLTQILQKDEGKVALEELNDVDLSYFISIQKEVLKKINELKQSLKKISLETIQIIENQGISIWDLSGKKNGFGKMYNAFANEKIEEAKITDTMRNRLVNDDWYTKSAKAHIKNALDSIHDELVEKTATLLKINDELTTQNLFNQHFIGFSLLNSINKVLTDIKKESNIVFLNDFNEIISQVVKDEPAPFIYEKIGNRYHYFLIDEFQDTSNLQWNNLVPLVYDSLSSGNKNLIVGDAKQAIYRWRGGAVNQFIDLPTIKGDFHDLQNINRIFDNAAHVDQLKKNYRSYTNIIEFNNWLFSELATLSDSNAIKAIYEGIEQETVKKEAGYVSYKILEGGKEEIKPNKLAFTLEYIQECLSDGFVYKDIAILTKTNKDGKLIAAFLTENNIPVVSSDSIVLGSSEEVKFLIAFLEIIINNENEHAILKCLQFLQKEEHLSVIHEKWRVPSEKNNAYSKSIDFKGFLLKKYPKLNLHYFESLNLYDKTIYLLEVFQLNRFDAYIDQFLNTIQGYTKKNTSSLQDFIVYFEDNKERIPVNSGGNNSSVQITTIHKSKGLQYPVVIVPFADWPDKNHQFVDFTWFDTEGVVDYKIPKYIAPIKKDTLHHLNLENVYEKEQQDVTLDNLNLFYVAFTRPEKRMYVISSKGKKASNHVYDKINALIVQKEGFNAEENIITWGKRSTITQKDWDETVLDYEGPKVTTWRSNLGLSLDRNALELEVTELDEREYGNAVHHVWSAIQQPEDLNQAIDKAVINGVLPKRFATKVEQDIAACLALEEVNSWYNIPDSEALNESAIVAETGQSYRPDKIILTPDKKAIVIDYKTGQERKSHQKQLRDYGQLLNQLGYDDVKLCLLYMQERKVLEC